jgi:hypothetical protein
MWSAASNSRDPKRQRRNYSQARRVFGMHCHVVKEGTQRVKATWIPHEKHGRLTKQSDLPETVFAFPAQRKEPLTDATRKRHERERE